MRRIVLLTAVAGALAPAGARGAVTLAPVGTFSQPVYVTAPPGDASRLFVVEQTGRIRVVRDGAVLPTPFLDLASAVTTTGGEEGLLSMAFAPDYATSGRFYVDYTAAGGGDIQVVEYRRASADVADASSARPILTQAHRVATNHNGGQLEFGPDGHLYIGIGDGGGANDEGSDHNPAIGNGQDLGTWLGKILRIDPTPSGGRPYTVPPDNPFVATPGARPEIWAYGLRNPWRFSFDRATGDLWIGDVGQNEFEEVDHAARGAAGLNYGWRNCEGTHAFDPNGASNAGAGPCTASGVTAPVLDYHHDQGRCAVTGGYVVRDPALADLAGSYVYGDYCTGDIWSVRPPAAPQLLSLNLQSLSSFGEDACGRLFAASAGSGAVVRLSTGAATAPCPTAA
ncbi:MAG: glucose/sorbosone dehydrogenase-like protein, partial [Solirubrobacterales bacterium]|nr:glucose/sorbosone dehydrogenase-like protein [Solirubrobacterales bacterium]